MVVLLLAGQVFALEPQTGPVIEEFGAVYGVPSGAMNLNKGTHYKAVSYTHLTLPTIRIWW